MLSYWKRYRKIKANVGAHLSNIYKYPSPDEQTENKSDETNIPESRSFSSDEHDELKFPDLESLPQESFCPGTHLAGGSGFLEQNHGAQNRNIEGTNIETSREFLMLENCSSDNEINDDFFFTRSKTSSSSSLGFSDDETFHLRDELRNWVADFNIPHSAVSSLLKLLQQYHPELPKDARTLLNTTTNFEISQVAGGFYHHFGMQKSVLKCLHQNFKNLSMVESATLQLNIDGLPLFKSSNEQVWPILGKLIEPFSSEPFVIGIFSGNHKPSNAQEYLQELINEINILTESGLQVANSDHVIAFNISCIICDTPARAFVKQVKGHSGYSGCDKCKQRGFWKGKMTFPEINAELRTDAEFDEMSDLGHHIGVSPFRDSPVGLVSQFPLDFMHLVCLGVMKRLLLLWLRGPVKCRLGSGIIK